VASYVITYDLNKAGQNYEALEKAIKSYNAWAKIATTTFVIRSDNSSNGIRDHLKAQMDANDELFVGKLSGEGAWFGLGEKVSQWLKDHL
jgi:hypothetical protein